MVYLLLITFLQIVTESFPVSSSGNCTLLIKLLKSYTNIKTVPITKTIDFLMHGPTILVIFFYFFQTITWYSSNLHQSFYEIIHFLIATSLANGITLIGYILFRHLKIFTIPLWLGFFITSILLFSLPFKQSENIKESISYRDAAIIGTIQGISLLPGISRLASTYTLAYWLGYKPKYALGYSLAFQFPLLCAAFIKGLYGLATNPILSILFSWKLFLISFIGGIIAYYGVSYVQILAIHGKLYLFYWYTTLMMIISLLI